MAELRGPPTPEERPQASMKGGFLKIVLLYAAFASTWIVVSDHVASRLFGDVEQLAAAGMLKGLLFVGVTSLLLLVLLQRFVGNAAMREEDLATVGRRRWMMLIFVVLATAIAAIGWFSYRALADTVEREETAKLAAVAEFKANQVEDWLAERRADVGEIARGSLFRQTLLRWLPRRGADDRARLLARMDATRQMHGYAAIEYFDPDGRPLLAVGDSRGMTLDVAALAAQAGNARDPLLVDLTRTGKDGSVRFAYVGLIREGANADGAVRAIALFSMDPGKHLFPMIQAWPYPIPSGEAALVRREGDGVVFLTALRYGAGGAMGTRVPLSRAEMPAVQAAMNGPGVYRGTDYRGTRVFAAARKVSGTPWLVLAKVDHGEVFRDIRRLAAVALMLTLGAIAACGLLLALIWRQQRWRDAMTRADTIRQAQRQIEDERSRLQTLVQTIPDLVWLKDPDGAFVLCNPGFEHLVGAAQADVVGKTDYDLVPKDLADFFRAKDREAIAAGKPTVNEEWVQFSSDGHRALLETIKTPMYDAAGRLVGVLGIGRDITARRAAEEQLRKLWMAVEQSPNGVIITDIEGRIEYVNEACLHNSGYSREELVGRNPRVLGSGQTPRETYQALWQALKTGRRWQGEFTNRRKNGEIYIDFVRISPVRQPDGKVSHYLAVQEDITERKRMGQELDQHRFHLEELVAQRTAQLAAAREAAEVANRAKGAFVAGISHEIRTPLNAIIGFTHLLQRHSNNPDQVEKLGKIDEAAHHLLSVINDILDFSKIEAGKVTLEERDFDLGGLLDNVCALVRDKAKAKGLTVAVVSDPALPASLRGDPTRLAQALLNYLSNAVKFSDHGAVVLAARLMEETGGMLRVRFSVQDEGIGIDAATQSRLFADFEQADQSTTRRYGGTGLGLAITRRLAALMGGEVGVASEPGVGSTFFLVVPLGRGEGLAPPARQIVQPAAVRAESALLRDHYGSRLLLAEDNLVNREVATELLREAGCRVDLADDGRMAVEMAQRHAYDLILMDVHMPVMDGLEAARAIRALPGHGGVPIIALTASAFNEDRQRCLDAGMNDYLAKPVDPDTLFATLLKWLPQRGAAATAPRPATTPEPGAAPPLPEIAGLDAAVGLATVRGRASSYVRLLRLYAETHRDDMDALRGFLQRGERSGAVRVAHSLKSASAMMGAMEVQGMAAELEKELHDGCDDREAERRAAGLAAKLVPLADAILAALPAEQEAPAARAPRQPTLERLQSLLEQDDIDASQVFRDALPELRALLGPAAEAFERQMANYDYAQALATLRSAQAASDS
ncbi:MAG TPA: PAS domain S-box protein [Rhodocyclaceae bacterium]